MKQYIDLPSKHKGKFEPTTLKEHWNSEYMKDIRRRMMAGEEIPQCQVCNDQILNLWTYRQYFNQTLFPERFNEIYKSTQEDGSTTTEVISFDYRLSNLCNFKCRMCGPPLSSSWEAERRIHGDWNEEDDPWMVPKVKNVIEAFQTGVLEKELEDAIHRHIIREVYWVGGEPLMWDAHWRLMDKMVKNGSSRNVVVRYNTNLSRVEWKGKNLYHDYLKYFRRANICASLDATGKIGEFIRTGLDWEKWKNNWEQGYEWKALQPHPVNISPDFLVVDLTITLPGLFGLVDLVKFANYYNSKIYTKLVFAFDPAIVLSPFALPRKILDPFLDDLIKEIEPITNERNSSVLDTLKEMKTRPTFAEQWPDTYEKEFLRGKETQMRLAEHRKDGEGGRLTIEEIYAARPDVLEWWKNE
jgi:organic radical activating enzyme